MISKPKLPAKLTPKSKAPLSRKGTPLPPTQADSRWQRTVRYNWDKGGAKGGR